MLYLPSIHANARILLTVFIITLVCSYNLIAIYIFGKSLISAAIQKRRERLSMSNGDTDVNNTDVVPVEIKTVDEDDTETESNQGIE